MHPLFPEFISYLDQQDKENCIRVTLSHLENKTLDTVTLYNEILTPAQNTRLCQTELKEICIWEEHVRTSIVRTIIECCYPYIVRERDEKYGSSHKGKAVVLCPPEELHEIGARMVADFFILCGFNVIFIGANTPQDDILNAIKYTRPKYVAISVTNYYNLVAARNVVEKILDLKAAIYFQLILGGQACRRNPDTCWQLGTDRVLDSFEDIKKFTGGATGAIA